ncbi:Protein CBG13667 [Caenorhabditis briggsae]|uniref:Protein CBG13667 n=1 Tax=Caenorhabditis briggsae TaxID=6238 RepID=A8XIF8_CAEBR|nr:Protein CBG13667 [Caenorhabditis briggsae]CAP32432.1 Protein CBG13667 [Caenorhabditis briggsae]
MHFCTFGCNKKFHRTPRGCRLATSGRKLRGFGFWTDLGQILVRSCPLATVGRSMVRFWPEFEGAACHAARATLILNTSTSETKTDDVHRSQKNNWMLENSKKDKKVNQAEPLLSSSSRFTATSSKF